MSTKEDLVSRLRELADKIEQGEEVRLVEYSESYDALPSYNYLNYTSDVTFARTLRLVLQEKV